MNVEVIKSYTLSILVGISLILTFSLWSYQPTNEKTINNDLLDNTDLGGTVESEQSLIQPNLIIFNDYGNYYGFSNPIQGKLLYEDMQEWVLYNLRVTEANGRPKEGEQVELIFPEALPIQLIQSMFTLNSSDELLLMENMFFQRMYVTFKANNSLTITFLSTDGKNQIRADVNNTQKHDLLENYMNTRDGLIDYMVLEEAESPIYIPRYPVEIAKYSGTITNIHPNDMRDALFVNPSEVIVNQSYNNELWYQDGQRTMHVFENEISMEYINPQDTVYDPMGIMDLIDESIARINGFKGWIHEFQLEDIDPSQNAIRYRMFYNGFPVFNNEFLASIEQAWSYNGRNYELTEHKGPLYKEYNLFSENYVLPSGNDVISFLKEESHYKISDIEDIRVGYRLTHQKPIAEENGRITLTPEWYVKIGGEWVQLILEDDLQIKGVS